MDETTNISYGSILVIGRKSLVFPILLAESAAKKEPECCVVIISDMRKD